MEEERYISNKKIFKSLWNIMYLRYMYAGNCKMAYIHHHIDEILTSFLEHP